jgi:hypothetical protein
MYYKQLKLFSFSDLSGHDNSQDENYGTFEVES